MQHLTNLRFRFNDGEFIKHMAYPEVRIQKDGTKVQLMNQKYESQAEFNCDFRKIIWVSYRKEFSPLARYKKTSSDE